MKEYFTNLFNFDCHSSLLLLPTIFEAGEPVRAVQIMDHLLAAQQIWLNQCKGFINANDAPFWPDREADTFEQAINRNHNDWLTFINDAQNADLNKLISYKNSKGIAYENTLTDILTHVIYHGTHHRGQIGQHLKLAGIKKLPLIDYIAFTRI